MKAFQRILVPLDLSARTSKAIELAARLVAADGTLKLLHVVEWVPSVVEGAFVGYANPKDIRAVHKDSKQKLDDLAKSCGVPGVVAEVVEGSPAESILEVAEHDKVDLIVIGTHGRSGLGHLLLGSVAERVIRRAPCPVLTVRG